MIGRMSYRIDGKVDRKAKKSYTLSPESIAFLEAMRKNRRAPSVSAILEEILQAVRRDMERASVELGVEDYYASLPTDEMKQQTAWGEFALGEFPREDRG